jgi:hypothetical protein
MLEGETIIKDTGGSTTLRADTIFVPKVASPEWTLDNCIPKSLLSVHRACWALLRIEDSDSLSGVSVSTLAKNRTFNVSSRLKCTTQPLSSIQSQSSDAAGACDCFALLPRNMSNVFASKPVDVDVRRTGLSRPSNRYIVRTEP